MKGIISSLIGSLALMGSACAQESASTNAGEPVFYGYDIVNEFPHDESAFTQGLFFHDGALYESTGQVGQSVMRKVTLETGETELIAPLPAKIFGEGSTRFGDNIYVLSWVSGTGFILDAESFAQTGTFSYEGEGWGLTHDGTRLIMSDGTPILRFLDPQTQTVTGELAVTFRGKPLPKLNELEWIDGEIFANVWQSDAIVRIDPKSGIVTGIIDMRSLLSDDDFSPGHTDVLNGIAYDRDQKRLFVTGKYWPKLFEIELTPKTP